MDAGSATWTTRPCAGWWTARATVLREGAATGRAPATSTGEPGDPAPAAAPRIRVEHQGSDLPRLTFWCATCQPDPRSPA